MSNETIMASNYVQCCESACACEGWGGGSIYLLSTANALLLGSQCRPLWYLQHISCHLALPAVDQYKYLYDKNYK